MIKLQLHKNFIIFLLIIINKQLKIKIQSLLFKKIRRIKILQQIQIIKFCFSQ
jgi:hypothetical protein